MRTKKPKIGENAYRLRITLLPEKSPMMGFGKRNIKLAKKKNAPSRDVVMLETHNLYQFAEAITQVFLFYFDHCFGFSDAPDKSFYSDAKEKYELFVDIGEDPPEGSLAVKTALLKKVFPTDGKKMLFYFDYGDGWHFCVERIGARESESQVRYPLFFESRDDAPEQYPGFE